MKYSNVFPIFICMSFIFFIVVHDNASRKTLIPSNSITSYVMEIARNYSTDCDLIDLVTNDQYYFSEPGLAKVKIAFPIHHDQESLPAPIHIMNMGLKRKLNILDDKCQLLRCD